MKQRGNICFCTDYTGKKQLLIWNNHRYKISTDIKWLPWKLEDEGQMSDFCRLVRITHPYHIEQFHHIDLGHIHANSQTQFCKTNNRKLDCRQLVIIFNPYPLQPRQLITEGWGKNTLVIYYNILVIPIFSRQIIVVLMYPDFCSL